MARTEAGLRDALGKIPALREEFWHERQRARHRRRAQPVAREGRPRRRLPRARRADVHRRAATATSPAAATSARSTRPPTARPCATTSTSPTSRPGSYTRRRQRRPTAQGAARVRVRAPEPAELQVNEPHPERSGGRRTAARRARSSRYQVDDVDPDMSFLEMLDVLNERLIGRARSRSRSTTTAARASAAPAAS